jgi:citrate lyase subunit beta/citryl-CoA lyase
MQDADWSFMMRSKLFVPASRPELYAKALNGAADAVSFDLEDAVEESRKAHARDVLRQFLGTPQAHACGKTLIVRVNAAGTTHFSADLDACVQRGLHLVNLPKVEDPDVVRHAAAMLDALERERGIDEPVGILANIESPAGLRRAACIAKAHRRVAGLQIGFGDLLGPLGISQRESFALQSVRLQVRMASGEAGVDAYDGAFVDIADSDGYAADAKAAYRMGFAGKSCIHPTQVALANDAFRPGEDEIAHALRVVSAAGQALADGIGAFKVDGKLVDGPFIARAQRIAALARKLGMA